MLLPTHSLNAGAASVTFRIATTQSEVLQAVRLCHEVYVAAGYLRQSVPAGGLPAPDADDGLRIIAVLATGEVAGTLRVSLHRPVALLEPWQGKLYHRQSALIAQACQGPSFSIGALAVSRRAASLRVSWGLYQTAYRWAIAAGREYGIIAMDQRAFRALQIAGWYAVQAGEPMHYLGSATVPAIIPIGRQPAIVAAKAQPWFHYSIA